MQIESCPKCGIIVEIDKMVNVKYEEDGKRGEYFKDEYCFWIFCPCCENKIIIYSN